MMIRVISIAVTFLLAATGPVWAGEPSPSDTVRAAIRAAQTIPPGGIDELKTVEINGIPQWISVRGNDPANPILLFIHGGPGAPMMPLAWTFQRPWEEYFTVVQWDQRGAGKTFTAAHLQPDESMTLERMQADAEAMIEWLRKTYGKDRIFVMAHSFGTILGIRIAQRHPEWLYAYIGVGQVVNARRNEEVSYEETLALAEARSDTTALRELRALAPYPGSGPVPLDAILQERKWVVAYGGMLYGKSDADESAIIAASPLYSDDDVKAEELGELTSAQILLPQSVDVDFGRITTFTCPVFFFAGADDRTTPTSLVRDYFAGIHAPRKQLFVIPRAAHFVVTEAPGEVLVDLVRDVRPLAGSTH
ncbi:MAG TPA: alpha/beta hydrolase [Candidatus Krumholzibacteria bacterium]|nr:alpha/beta hydrolase [Candidatus Krumholzibacteria bacterium]